MAQKGRIRPSRSLPPRPDLDGLNAALLLSGLPSGALLVYDGAIAQANERAAEILGRPSASLIGLDLHGAVHGALSCPGGCDIEGVLADPPKIPSFVFANFGTAAGEKRRVRWSIHEFSPSTALVAFEEAYERSLMEADTNRLLETQEIAKLGSWDWYTATNRVVWTPELYRIFGIERSDFEGNYEAYLSRVHPSDRERVAGVIDSAFQERSPFFFDHRVERPDGKLVYVSCSGRVFVDPTGRVERMSGTVQDVTERKVREQILLDREAELRLIVDQMPVIVWTVDKDLRNTGALGPTLEIIGVPPSALKGMHLFEMIGDDDPNHPTNAAHIRALQGESVVYTDEAGERTFRIRVEPLTDGDGEIMGALGVSVDVSDEIRAEKELQEAHENYRSLIEAIPAVSYIDSIRGEVKSLFVSPQIKDIFGFTPEEVNTTLWAGQLHPDDRHVIDLKLDSYSRGESFEHEYRLLTRDGKTVWVRDQAVFVRDEEGNAIFAQGIMYDITDRKRLEEQLVQSHKMDAIGRLTGGIAHDFNNLLTAILGNCYLALEDDDDLGSLRTALGEIKEAAELGATLVSQLLGFSRRKAVEADLIDLRDLVISTKSLLERVIGEDISLQTKTSKRSLIVRADSTQITQVILNLVVNAREAMPAGGRMQLEVMHSDELRETSGRMDVETAIPIGPHAVLRVADSGTGMDAETRASVFEPFFTTKERGARSGTGLGMSIVYGIVTRANGYVTVDSNPGEGTRVSIFLPLEETAASSAVVEMVPIDDQNSGSVLIVEDDDRVRAIAGQMLRRMGYEVVEAPGANEAIEIASRREFDVLLTDVVMPGMDGTRLAELLVLDKPDLKVVFMSGYQEALWDSGSPPSGTAFIQKPFRREDLAEKLRVHDEDVIVLPEATV